MSENMISHLPERPPSKDDYHGYDRIEVVHFPLNAKTGNTREQVIRQRLQGLKDAGIEVREVDIDTDSGDLNGAKIAVGGSLGDVCAAKRRRFILDHGGQAVVDTSLTSDY